MTLDVMSIEKMMMNNMVSNLMDKYQKKYYGINKNNALDNLLLLTNIKPTKMTQQKLNRW